MESLQSVVDNPEKVLKLDQDISVEEVEEFFRDSDDDEQEESSENNDTDENFEILEPTEAEKQMFEDDMKQFKQDVAQERQRYQPTTREKLFAMAKSLILRAIIFYFILWLLRRGSSSRGPLPPTDNGATDDMFDDEEELLVKDEF